MRLTALFLMVASISVGSPALADMTATYVRHDGKPAKSVEIASNGDVRAVDADTGAYTLVRGGHGYLVWQTAAGPVVMRAEDVSIISTELLRKAWPSSPLIAAPAISMIKGGIVTVRGRRGIAYYIGPRCSECAMSDPALVISTDRDLAPLAGAMASEFATSVGAAAKIFSSDPVAEMRNVLAGGAPLLLNDMELDSVSHDAIASSRFDLPAEPLTLERAREVYKSLVQEGPRDQRPGNQK